MNESELWAVALGTGMLGLLLLTMAGAIAMVLSIRARRARDAAFAGKSQANTEVADAGGKLQSRDDDDVPSTGKSRSRAKLPETKRAVGGGFWPWVKAWIFALVHAGTVSVVLGGITFFEDLAKAGEEIQHSGTVTFPKQLLPGTLTGSATRKRLSQPSDDAVRPAARPAATPYEDLDRPADPPPDTEGWEVVDLLEEADTDVTSRRMHPVD
jgi:hypothetical protein